MMAVATPCSYIRSCSTAANFVAHVGSPQYSILLVYIHYPFTVEGNIWRLSCVRGGVVSQVLPCVTLTHWVQREVHPPLQWSQPRPHGGGRSHPVRTVRLGVVARRQQVSVALVSVQIILPPALLRVELGKFDAQLNVNDCAAHVHVHVCTMSHMSLPCTSFLSPLSRPLSSYVCTRM